MRFYQHDRTIMCCNLEQDKYVCKTCHRLKRKHPHIASLIDGENRFCVYCKSWKHEKLMQFNPIFIDKRDNICRPCFQKNYMHLTKKIKGVKKVSLRVVKFELEGEMRRCVKQKHWVPVKAMSLDSKYIDGIGVCCKACILLPPRKVPKSIRKHHFGGRKIKGHEYEKLRKSLI